MDREIKHAGGHDWAFRLMCEFVHEGKDYRVTPLFWRTFGSEKAVQEFLGKQIGKDNGCLLYMNSRNPLQTELAAGDIADKLLH